MKLTAPVVPSTKALWGPRVIAERPPNAHPAPKIAVDVPSGLDCDTGAASRTTIRAAHTCTFVAQKPGFLIPGAEAYTGLVHVLDIGAPRKLVEACLGRSVG